MGDELSLWNYFGPKALLCSQCFGDHGLRLTAQKVGFDRRVACKNCGSLVGKKLSEGSLHNLAKDFFVNGTFWRTNYGGAPRVQYNQHQKTSVEFGGELDGDAALIAKTLGIGFFRYGPRLWMVGEVTPLIQLQDATERDSIIERILDVYPVVNMASGELLYRMRTKVNQPSDPGEYDGQPLGMEGAGRLDSTGFPMLYASQDIQVCLHECRAAVTDEIFVGTLTPTRNIRLLDLGAIINDGDVTDFERLDLAVNMLFLAGAHSYEICRALAIAARARGFDGIVYPSSFSLLRSGSMPFETVYGISYRSIEKMRVYEERKVIRNLAVFGRPIEAGVLEVMCINRVFLRQVEYDVRFGPADFS